MKARQMWSDADLANLRLLAAEGADSRAIALRLGRRVENVQTKARSVGITLGRRNPKQTARERAGAYLS